LIDFRTNSGVFLEFESLQGHENERPAALLRAFVFFPLDADASAGGPAAPVPAHRSSWMPRLRVTAM
jgi:hypothetical protein